MTIAIVGANGQVGRELTVMLKEKGCDIKPIVRNEYGGSFFNYHGVDYHIAEFTEATDAEDALVDIDTVVIAARDSSSPPRKARKQNAAMIRNSVSCSQPDATVVYFSSIMAFGNDVYESVPERPRWNRYRMNKLWYERMLRKQAGRVDKQYYSLRLGHVFGVNQERSKRIRRMVSDGKELAVSCDPEDPSNVVHTSTLADALIQCRDNTYESGTYSVVNSPQWTWSDVFSHYADGDPNVTYHPEWRPHDDGGTNLINVGILFELGKRANLTLLFDFLPERINDFFFNWSKLKNAKAEVSRFENRRASATVNYMPIFGYDPIPGPFLDDLPDEDRIGNDSETVKAYFIEDDSL